MSSKQDRLKVVAEIMQRRAEESGVARRSDVSVRVFRMKKGFKSGRRWRTEAWPGSQFATAEDAVANGAWCAAVECGCTEDESIDAAETALRERARVQLQRAVLRADEARKMVDIWKDVVERMDQLGKVAPV